MNDTAKRLGEEFIKRKRKGDKLSQSEGTKLIEEAIAEEDFKAWLKLVDSVACDMRYLVRATSLGAAEQHHRILAAIGRLK